MLSDIECHNGGGLRGKLPVCREGEPTTEGRLKLDVNSDF